MIYLSTVIRTPIPCRHSTGNEYQYRCLRTAPRSRTRPLCFLTGAADNPAPDLADRKCRVEPLWTDVSAVHDCAAAKQFVNVIRRFQARVRGDHGYPPENGKPGAAPRVPGIYPDFTNRT